MHEFGKQKESEIEQAEARLEQLKQEYEPCRAQEDINLLLDVFPNLSERLRIAQLCKGIGLAIESIKSYLMPNPYLLQASSIRLNTIEILTYRMPNYRYLRRVKNRID